jgi:hypothetical protein
LLTLHFIISVPNVNSIRKTIVSEDILSKDFVCNLTACRVLVVLMAMPEHHWKETTILEGIYQGETIPAQIAVIEAQGTSVVGTDGELETPN